MDEKTALLRAILENPDDDTVRLVYADFLEERGEGERAEFIRVQCALASRKAWEWSDRHVATLYDREQELLYAHGTKFGLPSSFAWILAREVKGRQTVPFAFISRGFVSAIMLTQADFLKHAPAIFQSQPVTQVTLSDREPMRGTDGRYSWWEQQDGGDDSMTRHELHPDIFYADYQRGGFTFEMFDSSDSAGVWHSDQCVRFGRSLAGLPPLPAPPPATA